MTDFLTRLTPRPNHMPARKPSPVTISNDQQEIKIYTTESHGRPLHQLSFYRGGKRERRSFADLNEAKREARIILGGLARDSIQAENLTGAEIQSYVVARRVLAPLNTPVHVAAERYAETQRELPGGVSILEAVRYWSRYNLGIQQRTINDLLEEYLAARQATRVSSGYLYVLRRFLGGFGKFTAGRVLSSLRCQDLDDWLQTVSWGPTRKNDARQKIISFTKWAKGRGFVPRDFHEFDAVLKFHEPLSEISVFTPEELEQVLNAARGHLATPYIAIGAFAGLRSAEIQRLDWRNVNFERGFIEVRAETCKTRARRRVPISDNLRAWLKPFALPGGPVVPYANIHCVAVRIAKNAGVVWKKNVLRHSFVSYRVAATNDGAKTALEAGHNQNVLFRHYREVVSPDMAAKWFLIMPPIEMERGMVGICRSKFDAYRQRTRLKWEADAARPVESRAETTICPV